MSTETGTSLRVSRIIKAAPETVFLAWTEPDQMSQWSAPEGMSIAAEVDLEVGGSYRVRMTSPEGQEYNAVGTYREIDRPKRLVYTWAWEEKENDVGETVVTVEFNAMGDSTEVVVTHELFPDAKARDDHEQGWTSCINRLEKLF